MAKDVENTSHKKDDIRRRSNKIFLYWRGLLTIDMNGETSGNCKTNLRVDIYVKKYIYYR